MAIEQRTAKPAAVRVCGPWDGTDKSAEDFVSLLGEDNWSSYPGGGDAEYWDGDQGRWIDVRIGQYLAERAPEKYIVLDETEFRELYEPAGANTAAEETS